MAGTTRTSHRRRWARTIGVLPSTIAVLGASVLLAFGIPARAADDAGGRIERIDIKADPASTRVIIMLSRPIAFHVRVLEADPAKKIARRLVLDFDDTTLAPDATKPIDVANDLVRQVRPGQFSAKTARIVLDLVGDAKHAVDAYETPPHVTVAVAGAGTAGLPSTADVVEGAAGAVPASAAAPAASAPAAAAAAAQPSVGSDPPKTAAKTIPIRARGRRPYSLMYR